MGRRLLFLGPPGAGKGTQAKMTTVALGIPHVSTGVMLREETASGTELGVRAAAIMEAGDLVPDDLVVTMVEQRLARDDCAHGYLLDGFPRNAIQAAALDEAMGARSVQLVLYLDVPEEELVDRLLKRASEEGRADDTEQAIRRRLEVYRKETEPLLAYYPGNGIPVANVDGVGKVEDVFARVALALAVER